MHASYYLGLAELELVRHRGGNVCITIAHEYNDFTFASKPRQLPSVADLSIGPGFVKWEPAKTEDSYMHPASSLTSIARMKVSETVFVQQVDANP